MPLAHVCSRRATLGNSTLSLIAPNLRTHRPSSILRPSAISPPARGLFGGKRSRSYPIGLEPVMSRVFRYGSLRTKAKLLDKLRRRDKFEWDSSRRPHLTQKHIRWASHYNGRSSRGKWPPETEEETGDSSSTQRRHDPDADVELSKRESKWKEHMEAFRKRVEQDPYEAVFGTRLEPFWGSFVPNWIKNDRSDDKSNPSRSGNARRPELSKSTAAPAARNGTRDMSGTDTAASIARPHVQASASSWNSWTNTARRTEWDNVTGKSRTFEYDPITNRMIEVNPKLDGGEPIEIGSNPHAACPETIRDAQAHTSSIKASTKVVTTSLLDSENHDAGSITAASIRAAMGKSKRERQYAPAQMEETAQRYLEPSISRMTTCQDESSNIDPDDAAAHESTEPLSRASTIPKQWAVQADILQGDRIRRTTSSRTKWPDTQGSTLASDIGTQAAVNVPQSDLKLRSKQSQIDFEEANKSLKAEVEQQNLVMQAQGRRYSEKVQSLRKELDNAYKQSSKHSEAHLDHIRTLEAKLSDGSKADRKPLHAKGAEFKQMRSEGDICPNVGKYSNSNKWYKRPCGSHLTDVKISPGSTQRQPLDVDDGIMTAIKDHKLDAALDTHERPALYAFKKDGLANEISGRQQRTTHSKSDEASVEPALALHGENDHRYEFKKDSLEEEVTTATTEVLDQQGVNVPTDKESTYAKRTNTLEVDDADAAVVATPRTSVRKSMPFEADTLEAELTASRRPNRPARHDRDYKFQSSEMTDQHYQTAGVRREKSDRPYRYSDDSLGAELVTQEAETQRALAEADPKPRTSADLAYNKLDAKVIAPVSDGSVIGEASKINWAEPPVYKVLAYDSGNDLMSTATATSNFCPSEQPISITTALSQLYQPARFIAHFADLQKQGFQVIHGTTDLLIFKKAHIRPAHDTTLSADELVENVRTEAEPSGCVKQLDGLSAAVESVLIPKENAMAQEAANMYDHARTAINPIDPAVRRIDACPLTGNFASPTGFVNYDPVFPLEESTSSGSVGGTGLGTCTDSSTATHVKRTEPIYSGASGTSQGSWRTSSAVGSHMMRSAGRHESREQRRQRRRRGAGALRWAVSVGATSAALCYMIGLAAEASRQERREHQR